MNKYLFILLILTAALLTGVSIPVLRCLIYPPCKKSFSIDAKEMSSTNSTVRMVTRTAKSLKEGEWIKAGQVVSMSKKTGDGATFLFDVENPANYQVNIYLLKSPFSGIIDIQLNDQTVCTGIDLFTTNRNDEIEVVSLGKHDLKYENTLHIEVTGGHQTNRISCYQWGFEKIRITESRMGPFEKIFAGLFYKYPPQETSLSTEDITFLNKIKNAHPDEYSSQRKEITDRLLEMATQTESGDLQGKIFSIAAEFNYQLQEFREAGSLFKKAVHASPELIAPRRIPTLKRHMESSIKTYNLQRIKTLTKVILGTLILLLTLLYVITKPWRWITLKQILFILLFTGLAISVFIPVREVATKDIVPNYNYFYGSLFYNNQIVDFSNRISAKLMTVYVVTVIGIITAIIPLSRIRLKCARFVICLLTAFIIFTGTTALFCFRQFEKPSSLSTILIQPNEKSLFPYLTGRWYWVARDFKPYVISNPRKFTNLNVYNGNEPVFQRWLLDKFSKIKSVDKHDETEKK